MPSRTAVAVAALVQLVGCSRNETGASQSPAANTAQIGTAKPQSKSRRSDERELAKRQQRLFAAFAACGHNDLGNLDGHWVAVGSKITDVWICEGTIRFRAEWGGLSDVCVSSIHRLPDGIDAEAVYHEDIDDPGDATGAYLYFRHRGDQLAIEMEAWDEPGSRADFLVLDRKREPSDQPYMKCPPGFVPKPLP